MRNVDFVCANCNNHINFDTDGIGVGYATNDQGDKICYQCCAEIDKQYMRDHGRSVLYLSLDTDKLGRINTVKSAIGRHVSGKVTNWPGTLEFKAGGKIGRHNFAGVRYDVWFVFEGYVWHGVTYGNDTQICHVKRTKETIG